MATECPSLTTLTPDTILLTRNNIYELQVSTWDRTPGTVVRVKCQTGLVLQGQDTVTCLATGKWDLSPLPKCVDPPPTTTPSPGVDASLVLMIVLICVMAIVTIVMIVLCIALCHSCMRRKKNKLYRDPNYDGSSNDTASQHHSISGRRRADAHIHTHKVYHHHHTHAQNPKTPKQVNDNELDRQTWDSTTTEVENREGDGNFIIRDRQYPLPHKIQRRDEEYTITYVPLKVERSRMEEEPVPEARDSSHGPRLQALTYEQNDVKLHKNRRDHTDKALNAHAPQDKSVDNPQDKQRASSDITAYYGGLFCNDSSDAEDKFWKRPSSWNSLKLPRPQYRP